MKEYCSISKCENFWTADPTVEMPCIAFDKLDGSNLRFGWHPKTGWKKFGTRHRMMDKSDPEYGCAIDIFTKKYGEALEKIFRTDKYIRGAQEVICFCEFFGPNSFAGAHDPLHPALAMEGITSNDPKDVVLFDVNVHRKGLVPPEDFLRIFGHLDIPRVIYRGMMNARFIEEVREGKYPVKEGVICKGMNGPAPHGLWMRKIKTYHYRDEIKRRFSTAEWMNYWE